jgi:O-6-methylguanine DNA methyltransferase
MRKRATVRLTASAKAAAVEKPDTTYGLPHAAAFRRRVLRVVSSIPAGRVSTYGDVAAAAGRPRAARAVGNIMASCTDRTIPCHRVVAANGRLGGYGSSPELKRALLRAEGIQVFGAIIRAFGQVRWPSPGGTRARAAR